MDQRVSPRDTRQTIIRAMTFLGGLYFFLYFIAPESILEKTGVTQAHEAISNSFIVIGAMAVGLGIVNIVTAHGSKVIFRRKGWLSSVTLLAGLVAMLVVTGAQWVREQQISSQIRSVQVVGDFATRIIEDHKAPPGEALSFSPTGQLPARALRVAALERYAQDILRRVARERADYQTQAAFDRALAARIDEVAQEEQSLLQEIEKINQISWEEARPEQETLLGGVSIQAARFSSAYALMRRAHGATSAVHRAYELLYDGLFNQLGAAMFSLLGVYIAAAAYRAFRIQSLESALMMAAALIVMLGQISFGKMLHEELPTLRQWLLEVPNSAAFRAIRLGAGVAGLMLAIRMWLSIESKNSTQGGEQR
jgi:hypothetical protein